ncbi:MAG: class I SAM-dependent methyltransferase [Desulfobacteraceae bacterium]|nr:class I SAM-dependent methyltransferase [Desulfobacteraceae bacterium]
MDIQIEALKNGALLKDASIYNIQFIDGRPVFIDHLSFDMEDNHTAWPAYGQFCRHFLAPLALMAMVDIRLGQLYRVHLDGVPLDLAASLLPLKTKISPGLMIHLHAHAKMINKHADKTEKVSEKKKLNNKQLIAIAISLRNTVEKLCLKNIKTEWGDYYADTNYDDQAMLSKKESIQLMLDQIKPKNVWDLGGNTGVMSRLASEAGANVVSFDIDPVAIEKNYLQIKAAKEKRLLPCLMDFTNPSPGIGFASEERDSLTNRGPVDLALALALIHHLTISNNLPFSYVAEYFSRLCNWLILEFVPKEDSQVQRLLTNREDIFPDYTPDGLEKIFTRYFTIKEVHPIQNSLRSLYLMKRK